MKLHQANPELHCSTIANMLRTAPSTVNGAMVGAVIDKPKDP